MAAITNTFTAGTPWDPYRYLNDAMELLYENLGMALRVVRGFDDKSSGVKGSTLRIKVPQRLSVGDEPISGGTSLAPTTIDVVADHWRGIRFGATDKELAFGGPEIVEDHLKGGLEEMAKDIDTHLCALWAGVGRQIAWSSPAALSDLTAARLALNGLKCPLSERYLMVDENIEAEILNLVAISQASGSGDVGVSTQQSGSIGRRLGFDIFMNQNVPASVPGALTAGTALQINAGIAAGVKACVFKDSGGSLTGTIAAGDTFIMVGSDQYYVVTANASAGSNLVTVAFEPACDATISTSAVVTLTQTAASTQCLAFHRTAFALGMAELPLVDASLGVQSAVVTDPITNISMRLRRFYDKDTDIPMVAIDALWGVKTLFADRAVRITNP
jgi:hypothetical protein